MKKYSKFATLWLSIALVFGLMLFGAMVPALQNFTGTAFHLGFPAAFLTVHVSQVNGFVTHLSLPGLLADVALSYLVCSVISRIIRKKKEGGNGTDD